MKFNSENQINIRGNIFDKLKENFYQYKDNEKELSAFLFNVGKEQFPDIMNIDACTVVFVNGNCFVAYGKDTIKNRYFCP